MTTEFDSSDQPPEAHRIEWFAPDRPVAGTTFERPGGDSDPADDKGEI